MSTVIVDGKGKGVNAEVDERNRLVVSSTSKTAHEQAISDGRAYFVTTFVVNLTTDTESAVIYVKNTSDRDLFIQGTQVYFGTSTGGSGSAQTLLYINPTTGTMITGTDGVDFTALSPANSNIGKTVSDPFEGVARIGQEGTTMSGAIPPIPTLIDVPGETRPVIAALVPKGSALAGAVLPPPGNTSMDVTVSVQLFYSDV